MPAIGFKHFFTSCVPLQLKGKDTETNQEIIVWKNPRPSSPRFCRPIHIQFLHETTEVTVTETNRVNNEIDRLHPLSTVVDGKRIRVTHKLEQTMIDGKVCNALTGNSSTQRCYLCGATSKDFNDIDRMVTMKVNDDHLRFGLSTLHAWIRFFECCLHLSYKIPVQQWTLRGLTKDQKKVVADRVENIKLGFKDELGLTVDKPKPPAGTTNDGNTARRFFERAETSAAITGLNQDVICRFHVILQTLSCGHQINVHKFKQYCLETARLYQTHYKWYYMPTTVHKILIHGAEVLEHSLLPIGQMSEDAQESCNKYMIRFREDCARKYSRKKNLEDVFLRFLVYSDPYVSSQREIPKKPSRALLSQALELLQQPDVIVATEVTSSSSSPTDNPLRYTDEWTDDED